MADDLFVPLEASSISFAIQPPPRPIEEVLTEAEIDWHGDFGNLKIPPLQLGGDTIEISELATWIEEFCGVEFVQFEFMASTAIVRKKRK